MRTAMAPESSILVAATSVLSLNGTGSFGFTRSCAEAVSTPIATGMSSIEPLSGGASVTNRKKSDCSLSHGLMEKKRGKSCCAPECAPMTCELESAASRVHFRTTFLASCARTGARYAHSAVRDAEWLGSADDLIFGGLQSLFGPWRMKPLALDSKDREFEMC